ncbi:ubiquitin carboxyl-terminal hydrolase puf [Toxorhynchites rutilus septentrionalis]|uniref:ubiquitin carboxyl-terminal hydrolase puf n=1 Tax=Toxorhynchites rutilus septentrionalis TaxID=329112 RepID=UPI0024786787|nr:ubiquitin carboxyl-terminal hydrolase puf [Toxorhynchites rutilus septentrionalis]
MCDVCAGFLNLLGSYESRLASNETEHPVFLAKREIETVIGYIQCWPARQCMCCYRDPKNFERFNLVVQAIIYFTVYQLKNIKGPLEREELKAAAKVEDANESSVVVDGTNDEEKEENEKQDVSNDQMERNHQQISTGDAVVLEDFWTLLDIEKLLLLSSKAFLLNFPLYVAYKHGVHARMDEISPQEAQTLSIFCDLHDNEIPAFLLRNVSLFCTSGGFDAMINCFEYQNLPVPIAHAITASISNLKLWINYRSIIQLFIPIRVKILQYMCKLSDQDLRSPATKSMADFMWTAIKDPLDSQITFDTEGLALAFKYFTSSTLTMRLAGMAQINTHINLFNEICTTETVAEVEVVGQKLADWLTENQIISHLFGPNLHVEVIKQSHIVLNFLAVENQITEDHISLIWQAAQLKHCSKPIYDILPSLVKNLAPRPASHLYSLLSRLDPKEHTEQSIYIASALTKLIWARDCSRLTLMDLAKNNVLREAAAAAAAAAARDVELPSSSENSVSVDGSNSEDEPQEEDSSDPDHSLAAAAAATARSHRVQPAGAGVSIPPIVVGATSAAQKNAVAAVVAAAANLMEADESDSGAAAPPPCKQARHKNCCDETTDDSIKVEPDIYDVDQRLKEKMRMPLLGRSMVTGSAFNEDAGTSSEEDCLDMSEAFSAIRKKMLRKKRKKVSGLTRKELQEMAESVSDVEDSDLLAAMLPDSDCSDTNLQSTVLRHLGHHVAGGPGGPETDGGVVPPVGDDVPPFLGAMAEGHLINFLNATENDGSCSSPLSNKSEKNMGDFDDEDSPCEEELVELAARAQCLHQQFPLPRPRSLGPGGHGSSPQARTNTPNITLTRVHSDRMSSGSFGPGAQPITPSASSSGTPTSSGGKNKPATTPTNTTGKTPQAPTKEMIAASGTSGSGGSCGSITPCSPNFRFPDVCQPGNTLLWDLLQDDKIGQLGESLALEAEKVLGTLLCFHTDKIIRTRFIEGCLQNLAENKSVVTSLRLLPKLFASFQQFRDVTTHQVVLWAERHHRMMHHFFNNLKHYTSGAGRNGRYSNSQGVVLNQNGAPLYSHVTQIQVRLQFLSSVFSDVGSPRNFKLALGQVDTLWTSLANDPECSDCLFAWLQGQVKGGDTHALGINAIQHLYLKRLSELKSEGISMVALGLFQQLFTLGREEIICHSNEGQNPNDSVGMENLWKIALRANNTDVSLTAIQYINTYYMEKQLKYENQFVAQCMNHLSQAVDELHRQSPSSESALMCVQRALMLLNTHLETFRRRYAYHLRRWALEGKEIGAHSALRSEGPGPPIRIVLQPAGVPEKSVLHLHATDLVADLKAEIAKWWETVQGTVKTAHNETAARTGSGAVLGLLLSEGPLRIITQGQEITAEYDERSITDVGFKDNQMVYVSMGSRGGRRRDHHDHPSMQPPPQKDCLPTLLLLKSPYFEQLFKLMQTLGDMKLTGPGGRVQPNTKAQLLSRRVWDILTMLPTAPTFLNTLKNLSFNEYNSECFSEPESPDSPRYSLKDILDPCNLQKFMYSLHIVESLCKSKFIGSCCSGSSGSPVSSSSVGVPIAATTSGMPGGSRSAITTSASSAKSLSVKNQLKLKISTSKSLKMQNQKIAKQQQALAISCEDSEMVSPSGKKSSPSGGHRQMDSGGGDGDGKSSSSETETNKESKIESAVLSEKVDKKEDRKEEEKSMNETGSTADAEIRTYSDQVQNATQNQPSKLSSSPVNASLEWSEQFIKCGGLAHLYQIFISGVLQKQSSSKEGDDLNEWRHDCLASLLRILCLLGMEEFKPENENAIIIPKLNRHTLGLMEVRPSLERIASILNEESHPMSPHHFKTGLFGRAQVIHYAMNLLVCYAHSLSEVRSTLWTIDANLSWVQRLILDDPEPTVRREACAALYRLCLGNAQTYYELMAPLLSKLVSLLSLAEKMRPQNQTYHLSPDEGKEPYGPACRDYFWLLCRLVDSLSPDLVKDCGGELSRKSSGSIGIESMCRQVSKSILDRDYLESRHGSPDDGLFGLLNLMANLIKFDPQFKFSEDGQEFIARIFQSLFELPSPDDREKPKCKSHGARAAAYDLLVEMCKNAPKNYLLLHGRLMQQHRAGPHSPYPWDYWPRDEGRSECGYVGLTNLGATCYMASCIQHLFMTPQTRDAILSISPDAPQKHKATLYELQRMFAYLMESERKAYCPRSFCRVYQMDHQPLNTGEQKDMAEFFIDLVSKLEDMTPELKALVKRVFCGVISNNVVSLDCGHVSRTLEEFYTVRCQVADMRNLHESLDEVTVKDTLEGDNMYTCSQCGKKVRAEKRACFKKLPQILCFNTMRYTFNMVTMLKEKVNTHFSFPMRLDMSGYVEKTLMPHHYQEEKRKSELRKSSSRNVSESSASEGGSLPCSGGEERKEDKVSSTDGQEQVQTAVSPSATTNDKGELQENDELHKQQKKLDEEDSEDFNEHYEYDLVGVTVHTGNADGGHYYSFIKERNEDSNPNHQERWFLFNDAEVKLFDQSQIAAECFGGEMTSKTYDSVTEKYLDFSFEKTNSAYMLFYEWRSNKGTNIQRDQASKPSTCTSASSSSSSASSTSLISMPATTTTTDQAVPSSSTCSTNSSSSSSSSNNSNGSGGIHHLSPSASRSDVAPIEDGVQTARLEEIVTPKSSQCADTSSAPPSLVPPTRDDNQTEKLIQKQHPSDVASIVDNLSNLSKCDIDVKSSIRSATAAVVPSLAPSTSSSSPLPLATLQTSTLSILSPSGPLLGPSMLQSPSSSYSSISSLSALTATAGGNVGLPLSAVVHQSAISSALQPCSSSAASSSSLSSASSMGLVGRIGPPPKRKRKILSKELEEWIWQDNRHFLQDRNIFEHTYFNFMWQICGHIPQTLLALPDITCIAAQLSVSFFIETFIHAKEKPTMVLWVELLTKQFNASQEACEWFLSHMSAEPWWPVQVLIQCPNQMVRQMFQRLVIHVIQRLRQSHSGLYLKVESDEDSNEIIGNVSCVTRFIKSLIMLMEHGARAHLRHLSEFFGLLYEFSRMGEEEALFLLRINVIRSVADFYLGHKAQDCIDTNSDNEENSSDETLTVDKSRPASLDKMIALVASLVERSRGPDLRLHLSARDYNAIAGGKGFPFLYQQIKDNINPHQTRHLIHALCRCDERLAGQIIAMLFTAVTKHTELCGPFFKLLTLLTESTGGPSGLPCFSQLVLQRVWDAAEYCPQSALDWLAVQAPRNKIAHTWILQSAENWVETFLLAHNNARVRNAAAYLLVSLVPSQNFRTNYRATSHHKLTMHSSQHREISCEAQLILHTILNLLLRLLRSARNFTDISVHGTTKLTAFFNLMTYCLVSKTEKLMLGPHLRTLWELFHPRLSEPSVPAHHNKQALLTFWYQATLDCPENALLVANCPDITRNIAFNYILADHDDSEIVTYNRAMLPVYYGLLRMCCQQSRLLTRQLAAHQNLQWAFKNITPHPTQYPLAVDELFRLMTLFAQRHPDATEAEQREVTIFRRTTLTAYLNGLDARVSWGTLIAALRILVDNDDDRLFVVLNGGITLCFDALHTLHSMYHEATACHVFGDLQELLTEVILLISTLRASCREQKKRPPPALMKGLPDAIRRLATLLNTFNPPEMRNIALEVLKELVKCAPPEIISTVLVPLLTHCHTQNVSLTMGPLGSYFPRRGMKATWPPVSKNTPRPPRPMVQMNIPQSQICEKGLDKDFDLALELFYRPYHEFLDIMFRVAVTSSQFNEPLVHLSLLAGIEAVVLHFNIFAKFWVGIYNNKTTNRYSELLIKNPLLVDYIDDILRDERLSLNDPVIANFIEIYYPKVNSRLVVPRLLESICQLLPDKTNLEDICGDLQAIRIIGQRTGIPASVKSLLQSSLHAILLKFKDEMYSDEETPPKKRKTTSSVQQTTQSDSRAPIADLEHELEHKQTQKMNHSSESDVCEKDSAVIPLEVDDDDTKKTESSNAPPCREEKTCDRGCPLSGPDDSSVWQQNTKSEQENFEQDSIAKQQKVDGIIDECVTESVVGTSSSSSINKPTMCDDENGSALIQVAQSRLSEQDMYQRNLIKDIESHIELIFECLDEDDEETEEATPAALLSATSVPVPDEDKELSDVKQSSFGCGATTPCSVTSCPSPSKIKRRNPSGEEPDVKPMDVVSESTVERSPKLADDKTIADS